LSVKAKKLLKIPAIVYNASFSKTCPRNPNSIHNASVFTNFLSGAGFERNEAVHHHEGIEQNFVKKLKITLSIQTAKSDIRTYEVIFNNLNSHVN
jgi:hypothetical protein